MTLPDIHQTTPTYVYHEENRWYPGLIHTIEVAPSTREDWADQLKWIIHLDGELADDGAQLEVWAYCTQTYTPKSKLTKWATGLLGKGNLPETLNPTIFIGTRVEIMFETYQGQDRDGQPVEKERPSIMKAGSTVGGTPVQAAREQVFTDPDEKPF